MATITLERPRAARRYPFVEYVARRVGAGLLTLLVVSMLIFAGVQVLPGDAASAVLGRNATPSALAELRHQMHLDRPAPERYLSWLGWLLHGDLGQSATAQQPVLDLISGRAANSGILALITLILLVPLSLLFGVLAATRAGRWLDHLISTSSLAVIALPEFVIGTVLILIFAVNLKLVPPVSLVLPGESPLSQPNILVLPVATLLGASLAQAIRMVRAGMLEALRSDYVQMARLNGFDERQVVLRYALRNALAPTVQVIALDVQWLIGGIIVTEYVFGYPGLGQGLAQAVSARDIPLVQSVALLLAAVFIVINIVADLLVVFLIPKLRTAQ